VNKMEGELETRLLPYFNAATAANKGDDIGLRKSLDEIKREIPLRIQVEYRERIEILKKEGYKAAIEVLSIGICKILDRKDVENAYKYLERLKYCNEVLDDECIEDEIAQIKGIVDRLQLVVGTKMGKRP